MTLCPNVNPLKLPKLRLLLRNPKKTVRKAATKPKSTAISAAHKHHAKKNAEPVMETPNCQAPVQSRRKPSRNLRTRIGKHAAARVALRNRIGCEPNKNYLNLRNTANTRP